jgi:hypothetical protein
VAAAVYAASLMASLWFGARGAWGRFQAAYLLAWALVVGAWLYVMGGTHGVHGSPGYMLVWGLVYLLPFLVFANLLIGLLAFIAGAVGARRRAMMDDEAG